LGDPSERGEELDGVELSQVTRAFHTDPELRPEGAVRAVGTDNEPGPHPTRLAGKVIA